MPCPVHRSSICGPCMAEGEHACALVPIGEDEAIRLLLDAMRRTGGVSGVMERLTAAGVGLGRRVRV